jgi:methionyl aminopeptidase
MIKLKTKEDIAILREGGRRHAEIMKALVAMVKPGLTTQALEDEANRLIAAGKSGKGVDGAVTPDQSAFLGYTPRGAKRPYPASLCVSINDEVVHGIPNERNRVLKSGDVVSLDLGLVHGGLITDMAVTVGVGKVAPEVTALLVETEKALMAGIDAAKGGKRVSDISMAIERVGRAKNYGIVEELSGHGVGYKVHEDPFVPNYVQGVRGGRGGKGEILSPGLVIAVEPMFNLGSKDVTLDSDGYTIRTLDGQPSAHFEHTILITKSDAEILTII